MITYNHEKYIKKAIEGVLSQITNFDFLLLIGDDCSTDITRNIVIEYQNKYPEKIILKLPHNNLGVVKNFYTNNDLIKSKYVALCEGDDYWTDENKLQKQVDLLESNNEYIISAHAVNIVDENFKFIKKSTNPGVFDRINIIKKYPFNTLSVVYRNESFAMKDWYLRALTVDYILFLSLLKNGKAHILPDLMGDHVIHKGGVWSMTSNKYKSKVAVENFTLIIDNMEMNEEEKKIINDKLNMSKIMYMYFDNSYKNLLFGKVPFKIFYKRKIGEIKIFVFNVLHYFKINKFSS
jgi:glycosyltransferase involved in cell wall biosynthesis